jgi:hypothetical protein
VIVDRLSDAERTRLSQALPLMRRLLGYDLRRKLDTHGAALPWPFAIPPIPPCRRRRRRLSEREAERDHMSQKRSALDTLSGAEKATVLDELLAARPDLRNPAEAYAARLMKGADRLAVADDVEGALQGLDIDELNTRAGHRPGRGYVHPAEAADEILDEALQPFLDDLQRRAGLGMGSAAAEVAAGILLGLYNCCDGNSETLLEYAPDYAAERASAVVSDCAKVGIELPAAELLDFMPAWSDLLT